ncbi:MAG: DUF192 domain-containing protein [Betaproteobacteria bacterium]|nr:DUF192 domain-containing protein [Betaproteobacteria bacterium]
MIHKYLTILAASFLFILTENAAAQGPFLPIIELKAGMYRIEAELADTPAARQTGLMYRTFMPTNTGMLFVFPEKAIHCFWMRNTKLPLTIAFIDDDGKIVNLSDMEPETQNNHCPRGPVRFALEMNQKWFTQRALGPGTVITGLPKR